MNDVHSFKLTILEKLFVSSDRRG